MDPPPYHGSYTAANSPVKISDNVPFEAAAPLFSCIATVAVSLYSQRAGTRSLKLVAPWAGGQGAYAGKSIFIPGGAGNVGQFGESRTQFGSYKHS